RVVEVDVDDFQHDRFLFMGGPACGGGWRDRQLCAKRRDGSKRIEKSRQSPYLLSVQGRIRREPPPLAATLTMGWKMEFKDYY
ncbi:hypothetical protein NSP02_24075, partial [Salmonella enterica]|nr:hypothetical protein [Salmonella enterica]